MAEGRWNIFKRKPETKAVGEVTATPPLMEALQLLDGSPAGYGAVYRKITPVRTVVDFLADAIATTPLKVYRRAERGRPEVRDHPFAELLRNPNPDLTAYRMKWRLAADLLIYANAYWRKMQADRKRQIVPLPPYRVTPRGGNLLAPAFFDFFSPNGLPPQRFSQDDIVNFHLYDPEEPRIGSSKLEALRTILLEEVEASKYRLGYYRNHARLEGALEHPGQLSFEAQERLRTQFENTYAGSVNSGRTAIFEEGMKFTPLSMTPKDAEFMAGRAFVLEATARAFNLPVALLSLTNTATYASQREFHKQLYTEVLPPWFELIQSEIELQLMPWFNGTEDFYVEFVVEQKLRGDFLDRATILNTAIGRPWMTVREGRDIENMDDRGVEEDAELAVPVGPNLALEGMAENLTQTPLAPVTELPVAASVLERFFDRQERSVVSRIAAKHANPFDRGRWDAELAQVLGSKAAAQNINMRIEFELAAGTDPRVIFADLRSSDLISA
jgi:HK97 family phage portal protein